MGKNKAILKNGLIFLYVFFFFFLANKLPHTYWLENNIPLSNLSPTPLFFSFFAVEVIQFILGLPRLKHRSNF